MCQGQWTGVSVGDLVFGVPDYIGYPTAGASEYAVLKVWVPVPEGLDLLHAACLPMAVETATRSIDLLGLTKGQTIMVNGGGTMTGFAAVQIALLRGAHVITTAGETYADRLRAFGAKVTAYGDGMVERVHDPNFPPVYMGQLARRYRNQHGWTGAWQTRA